jgi:hypothetical protein
MAEKSLFMGRNLTNTGKCELDNGFEKDFKALI